MYELKTVPKHLQPVLEQLFSTHHRVDLGIQSILEGQTGAHIVIKVDDMNRPVTAQLEHGTFTVFAGAVNEAFIHRIKKPCAIQPSPGAWVDRVKQTFSTSTFTRYSFDHRSLNEVYLQSVIDAHPLKDQVKRLDELMVKDLAADEWGQYHFMNYNSPQHFLATGAGYGVIAGDRIAAACTSALVCASGIELNIITDPLYRKKGFATLVAARLIIECLQQGLQPHWDAANTTSRDLAMKLGYTLAGEYEVVVYK